MRAAAARLRRAKVGCSVVQPAAHAPAIARRGAFQDETFKVLPADA
jgi:hypothetical protein